MMPLQGSLSIERMCQLAGVSRAGFYRSLQERAPVEEEMETRSAVQSIAAEHRFEVYLNLASRMKLNGVNQLWVADITYIRLKKEFVYLAVVLDAFSRKVVGWALDRSLAARLPIASLEHLFANIEVFIEQYYNRCRLHSALGYRPPEEFEREASPAINSAGATMSFFRHGEIYQSDVRNDSNRGQPQSRPPAHRPDESPAGYSSASCSPAELASASPADRHLETEGTIGEGKSIERQVC